jgi:hypothetical protein
VVRTSWSARRVAKVSSVAHPGHISVGRINPAEGARSETYPVPRSSPKAFLVRAESRRERVPQQDDVSDLPHLG